MGQKCNDAPFIRLTKGDFETINENGTSKHCCGPKTDVLNEKSTVSHRGVTAEEVQALEILCKEQI